MSAIWSFEYNVRRGFRSDAGEARGIFLSALREHGFAAIKENINAEIADFGRGKSTQDDFVAVSGGKVCGFLILGPPSQDDCGELIRILGAPSRAACGELLKVFVKPSHRGHGVGSMLIAECIKTARERGYRELMLETHAAFADARRYYEKHGWTQVPRFGAEPSPTRVYMKKLFGPAPPAR
jgi:GNAT superfamily N-acetyltransferase